MDVVPRAVPKVVPVGLPMAGPSARRGPRASLALRLASRSSLPVARVVAAALMNPLLLPRRRVAAGASLVQGSRLAARVGGHVPRSKSISALAMWIPGWESIRYCSMGIVSNE